MCALKLKLWPFFCDFLAYFGQNLVAMATSLRLLQSAVSSLDWSTTKTLWRSSYYDSVVAHYILIGISHWGAMAF